MESQVICFVCYLKARNPKELAKHVREYHKGIKLLKCPCNKTFDRKQNFEDHCNSKHFLLKKFKCEKGCNKEFITTSARFAHYRKSHLPSLIKKD